MMKRIDKYLSNISIRYSESHKRQVGKLINQVYVPVSKPKMSSFKVFNLSMAGAMAMLFVVVISFFAIRGSGIVSPFAMKGKSSMSIEETVIDEDSIKDKVSEMDLTTVIKSEEKSHDGDITLREETEMMDSMRDEEMPLKRSTTTHSTTEDDYEQPATYFAWLDAAADGYADTDDTDTSTSFDSDTYKARSKKFQDYTKKSQKEDSSREHEESVVESEKSDLQSYRQQQYIEAQNRSFGNKKPMGLFIATDTYNRVILYPNPNVNSFYLAQTNSVDRKALSNISVNNEEVINYFSQSDSIQSDKELTIEGTRDIEQVSMIMITINPRTSMIDPQLTITFTSSVSQFQLIGYEIADTSNQMKQQKVSKKLTIDDITVVLFKIATEEHAAVLGTVQLTYTDADSQIEQVIQEDIVEDQIKFLEETTITFRNALFGYMVSNHITDNSYSLSEIDEYQANFVDKNQENQSEEIDLLLDNLQQSQE